MHKSEWSDTLCQFYLEQRGRVRGILTAAVRKGAVPVGRLEEVESDFWFRVTQQWERWSGLDRPYAIVRAAVWQTITAWLRREFGGDVVHSKRGRTYRLAGRVNREGRAMSQVAPHGGGVVAVVRAGPGRRSDGICRSPREIGPVAAAILDEECERLGGPAGVAKHYGSEGRGARTALRAWPFEADFGWKGKYRDDAVRKGEKRWED